MKLLTEYNFQKKLGAGHMKSKLVGFFFTDRMEAKTAID